MSARRLSDKQVTIPQNIHYLEFERSDGDSGKWPTDTIPVVDSEGQVNFMKPLDLEDPSSVRWRFGTGQGIAAGLKLPAGPTYVLKDWPAGYAFYDHHKGRFEDPRHDLYLFGSKARYRSVNEFIPHALWIMQDPSMNTANCLCKYCQKTSQKEVHASMAPGILRRSHGSESTPSQSKSTRHKTKLTRDTNHKGRPDPKVYAAVQRAPLPVLTKSSNLHPKQTMLVERNSDLRAIHSQTTMQLKRWYRVGELLWCLLDSPIVGPGANVVIQFWPGLVDEVKLKTKAIPQTTDSAYVHASTHSSSAHENGNDRDRVVDPPTGSVPWKVHQSMEYRMQLLGVNHSLLVADDHLLPYQAYVHPNELLRALQEFPPERLNFSRETLSKFNPCPRGKTPNYEDAVSPYAMAVEIGSVLSSYWCLTDEWAFEYTLPPPPSQPLISEPILGDTSLQAAGLDNAQSRVSAPSSSQYYENVSGPSSDMPTSDVHSLSARMVGRAPRRPYTQMRFQGLWWGGERIWTDELLRLKIPRRCIAPKGAENIFPPSGPGKSARDLWIQTGKDPAELGAGTRGVFIQLNGLFVVDAVQEDGVSTKKECRASGMLYELADADWSELDSPNAPDGNSTNGFSSAQLSPPDRMSFVLAPSPLNPNIFPRTGTSTLESVPTALPPANSSTASEPLLPNSQLSHPHSLPYLLPQAPEGYMFRPILPEGHEAVISFSLISGRYYPQILSHPLLASILQQAIENPLEKGGLLEFSHLWALEGLSAGFYNSVDPTHYKTSRTKMVEDADRKAAKDLEIHKQNRMMENLKSEEESKVDELESMDVDH